MEKKKLKLRKRRHICSDDFHPTRLRRIMDYQIRKAFPDKKERLEYIDALIKGLGEKNAFRSL